MKSYSQAGQDLFVHALLPKSKGTFLDIGCCHPTELSNTYALEKLGWTGLMIDIDRNAIDLCRASRNATMYCYDASRVDWLPILDILGLATPIDYLSLDVDAATLATLQNFPLDQIRFNVLTVEHDSYRFGDGPRAAMREILTRHGYDLVCGDVRSADGIPYEDWWCDRAIAPLAERFRCVNTNWPDIIAKI